MKKIIFLLLLYCLSWINADDSSDNVYTKRINLLFYLYEQTEDGSIHKKFLPFYSYQNNTSTLSDHFFFWPFLSAYKNTKNPLPTSFPHATEFDWASIPLLSLETSRIYPHDMKESSSFISFLFMSYFQETYIQQKYSAKSFYSLPLLTLYHTENLIEKDYSITKTDIGTFLALIEDINIQYKEQIYPVHDISIHPLGDILGDDIPRITRHARWGKDRLFQIFSWSSFSLFKMSQTYSVYPGAEYEYFVRYECNTSRGLERLFNNPPTVPITTMGILSPFFEISTSPQGLCDWQLLPLFTYHSDKNEYTFKFLPLGLEFGSKGIFFNPTLDKFFPICYHDTAKNRWDILWPLAYYQEDPLIPSKTFHIRLLCHYEQFNNSQGIKTTDFSLLEGFLLSYKSHSDFSSFEILPAGFLLGYYEYENELELRLLGCGFEKTAEKTSLQFLFLKIPISFAY